MEPVAGKLITALHTKPLGLGGKDEVNSHLQERKLIGSNLKAKSYQCHRVMLR